MTSHFERWAVQTQARPGDWLAIAAANGLRSLMSDSDNDPVVIFDGEGAIAHANLPARGLIDAEGVTSIANLAIHEHFTRLEAATEDVLAGESVRVVFTAQLPAGGMRSMVGTGIPLRDPENHEVVGGLFLVRASAGSAAPGGVGWNADDRLLRLAGRLAQFDGWTLDLADERIRWMNEGVTRLTRALPAETTVEAVAETLESGDVSRWQRAIARAAVEHNFVDIVVAHRLGRDERVVMRWTGKAVLDGQSGRPRFITGIAQDITEIVQAHEDRAIVERRLSDTLGALPDGVILFDPNETVIYMNAAASRMLPAGTHSMVGLPASKALAAVPELLSFLRDAVHDRLADARRQVSVDRGRAEWAVTAYLVDRSVGLLLRDVTEEQHTLRAAHAAELELSKARRWEALGTLAGGLAHDLNNALTPITIAANLLERSDLSDQYQPAVAVIEQAASRAKDMITQVQTFSELGRSPRGPVDLALLLTEIRSFAASVIDDDVVFTIDDPGRLPLVDGAATELYQVVTNLVINARDAVMSRADDGPREVRLSISSGKPSIHPSPWPQTVPEQVVIIAVADTGVGIAPSVHDRIFEPFFTTKGPGHGTGLGLPSAQRIVRWSGGRLLVDTKPGVGSTFTVELPVSTVPQGSASEPASPEPQLFAASGRRILLVDDEFAVLWAVEALLEENGYVVTTAQSVSQAIDYLDREQPFDVVVSDLDFPGESGLDIARAMGRRGLPAPFILMTGGAAVTDIPPPFIGRVRSVMRKPFHPNDLLKALADALTDTQEVRP